MDTNPCKELVFGTDSVTLESANLGWIDSLLAVLSAIPHDAQGWHTLTVTYEVGPDREIKKLDEIKVVYVGKECVIQGTAENVTSEKYAKYEESFVEPDVPSNLIEECDLRDLYDKEVNYLITK